MAINGNKKGKQFERDIANSLLHIFPKAQRMLEYQSSVVKGVDLENTGEFDIQCKRNQAYAPISKIKEIAVKDPDRTPVLVTKGNNVPAMAVLPWDKFVKIIERLGVSEKDEINSEIQIEANKTVPSLEHDDSIETTATEVEPETFLGDKYSNPAKGENTLSFEEAKEKLSAILGVEVREKATVPEGKIFAFFNIEKVPHSAYFKSEWQKESAAARLLASLGDWEKEHNAKLTTIYVRTPNSEESIPEFLTVAENEVEENKPTYSFL
jgi:hypothetical protein